MPSPNAFLRLCRQLHLYIGVFIAPALLFFAFTGSLQTAGFQDMANGPHWIKVLAQIHKKQTDILPQRKPRAPGPAPDMRADKHPDTDAALPAKHQHEPAPQSTASPAPPASTAPAPPATPPPGHLPEKLFFFLVCLGLFTSTLTGLYMSFRYNSNKTAVAILLTLGVVLPLLFLKF
jgi:hypothetical protein